MHKSHFPAIPEDNSAPKTNKVCNPPLCLAFLAVLGVLLLVAVIAIIVSIASSNGVDFGTVLILAIFVACIVVDALVWKHLFDDYKRSGSAASAESFAASHQSGGPSSGSTDTTPLTSAYPPAYNSASTDSVPPSADPALPVYQIDDPYGTHVV